MSLVVRNVPSFFFLFVCYTFSLLCSKISLFKRLKCAGKRQKLQLSQSTISKCNFLPFIQANQRVKVSYFKLFMYLFVLLLRLNPSQLFIKHDSITSETNLVQKNAIFKIISVSHRLHFLTRLVLTE